MTNKREDNTIILRGYAYFVNAEKPAVDKFGGPPMYSLKLAIADEAELQKAKAAGMYLSKPKFKKDDNEDDGIAKDEEGNPIAYIPYPNMNLKRAPISRTGKEVGPITLINAKRERISGVNIGNGSEVAVKMLVKEPAREGFTKGKSTGYPLVIQIISLREWDGSDVTEDFDEIEGGYAGSGNQMEDDFDTYTEETEVKLVTAPKGKRVVGDDSVIFEDDDVNTIFKE